MTSVQGAVSVVLPVVTVIIGICVPVATIKLTQWLGVSIDAAHRSALDAAIETALGKIIQMGAGTVAAAGIAVASGRGVTPLRTEVGVDYVRRNARAAVAHFKLGDVDIAEHLEARLHLARAIQGGVLPL